MLPSLALHYISPLHHTLLLPFQSMVKPGHVPMARMSAELVGTAACHLSPQARNSEQEPLNTLTPAAEVSPVHSVTAEGR